MQILVDVKNLALYSGGIAQFFTPLLAAWMAHRRNDRFLLVGPEFDDAFLPRFDNYEHVRIDWPYWLPRPLRHPFYDNVAFPSAVRKLRADLVFSPYHDIRLASGVKTVMTIHDTCLQELAGVYPRRIRWYHMAMLRHNLRRADHVLTVSESSRNKITDLYNLAPSRVHVVYNACHPEFASTLRDNAAVSSYRLRYGKDRLLLLYPGGSEYRKNAGSLLRALSLFAAGGSEDAALLVTGPQDTRWRRLLDTVDPSIAARVIFLGQLSHGELKQHYFAADVVVYPSLCEGFGRVCLESMSAGVPLACSDLPVLREVAGGYAEYFDPHEPGEIVAAIRRAVAGGRPAAVRDSRFELESVQQSFLEVMDAIMAEPEAAEGQWRRKAMGS